MNPQTFVFIGRSGCGKGTQVKLLLEYLKQKSSETPIYYMETGQRFREFIAQDGYTNDLAKAIMKTGARQPDFLAIWMWSHHFVENLTGKEHIVIDGTPRSLNEAKILDNAFGFYHREKPHIVHLNVSRAWSEERMKARGRADDVSLDIKRRLDWYKKDVEPAIDFYRTNSEYHFVDVNGEQTIEEVHNELMTKLGI